MRTGRPTTPTMLTTDEREILAQRIRRWTTAQALALRARIILACDRGQTNTAAPRPDNYGTHKTAVIRRWP